MFELNKIAGIANAAINTAEGISETLAAYPAPLNFALAAGVAAAGAAQISAIRSQSFGGGGGTQAVGASAGVSSAAGSADTAPSAQGGSGNDRTISIEFVGGDDSLLTGRQVRRLVEQINEAQQDGATLIRVD